MLQNKTIKILLFTIPLLLLLLALAVFFLLQSLPKRLTLSLCVAGEGEVTVSGGAQGSVLGPAEKTLSVNAGEEITLSASEGLSFWKINGVRLSSQQSFTLSDVETSLSVEATFSDPAAAEDADLFTPDTVVYEALQVGQNALRPFFPTVTQADDGTILVVYYYADGHALYNQSEGKLSGVLQIVRSMDNGQTWSEPETLVDLTDDNYAKKDYNREARDPNLQKLSDGTLILTFPVRAPIGKAGLNTSSGKLNDYWAERSYYMTSVDNGKTWSEMQLIECDYFSKGEPFLYDDPDKTTGCWVKNGSIAELENGDLLFPLYGAQDCSTRGDYTGVVVRAKNNGDGTLTFYKEWATDENGAKTDAAIVLPKGSGNELALFASQNTVYGLARTAIPSQTEGGVVYRSLDGGVSWEEYALEATANDCLNQPNFCALGGDLSLVNYSVPLASVSSSPARRTARPVYAKLFNAKTGDFYEFETVAIYDTESATVADMGNPASVLLSDGRIFTVFYDTSAPATKRGFIGGRFTDLSDYIESEEELKSALCALLA